MGIRITKQQTKMPRTLKIISTLTSYLFEEQFGECDRMTSDEQAAVTELVRVLSNAVNRIDKH